MNLEMEIEKYNKMKMDLLKVSKCIECCSSSEEKELYQDVALSYSKELKRINQSLEEIYDLKLCSCCQID